jgi:excisionase family DNA binding protein
MVVFVERVSVAEAAQRLGVGVSRIHQRIADGSLLAERIGSQWAVDEASLASAAERRTPGRSLSERSIWALVAISRLDQQNINELASSERSRARQRLRRVLAACGSGPTPSEAQVRTVATLLRTMLTNRADHRTYRASPRDLPDLRDDRRVALSGLSHPRSGIASATLVEGYVAARDIDTMVEDYLLSPGAPGRDTNVTLRVVTERNHHALRDDLPLLLMAADLADHRLPREETRAVELLHEIIRRHPELTTPADSPERQRQDDI